MLREQQIQQNHILLQVLQITILKILIFIRFRLQRKMSNIEKNFTLALSIFNQKLPFLAYKMTWKLQLILHLINGNRINQQSLAIQYQIQYEDLQNLDNKQLKLVFNNIIDTLFKDSEIHSQQCFVKKKGFFYNWAEGAISCDQNHFIIKTGSKISHYQIQQCQIKPCKQSKKAFQIILGKSSAYLLKFANQQAMKKIKSNLHKQVIECKTRKNYQQMTQFFQQNTSPQMFNMQFFKTISPQPITIITSQSLNKKILKPQQKTISKSPQKPIGKTCLSKLKPVPHGYIPKYQTPNLIIALRQSTQIKIYIQYLISQPIPIKKLISLLLQQKSWNRMLIFQSIQKLDQGHSILINRQYDTQNQTGNFLSLHMNVLYTKIQQNICMLTAQSLNHSQLESKSLITIKYKDNMPRIVIQDQLRSTNIDSSKLKSILYNMHKQILKLQLIYNNIVQKDFQAQTIIQSMLQQQQSRQSQYLNQQVEIMYQKSRYQEATKHDLINQEQNSTKQSPTPSPSKSSFPPSLHLTSPVEIPSLTFIQSFIKKQHERKYFKHKFEQICLKVYDSYQPDYVLTRLIKDKVFQITQSRELRFINQQLMDSQKDSIKFVLRQIGANLISGKSVLNVSLPVDIFQSKTLLQRGVNSFASSPDFLLACVNLPVLQQLKRVSGFIISAITSQLILKKPFNPILGQTFQGYIRGIPIYFQQISHSPAISSFFLQCPQYKIWGQLIPFADVGLNSAIGANVGTTFVQFSNGAKFQCYFGPSEISGLVYGHRKFKSFNKAYVLNRQASLFMESSIHNQKKGLYQTDRKLGIGELIGGIFKVKKSLFQQIDTFKNNYKNLHKFGGIQKQQVIQKLCTISGQWLGDVIIDGEVINKNIKVYPVQYASNVLPSDANFRLDVLYHKMKNLDKSQKQKQVLQNLQRNDRKLRQKYALRKH